MANEENLKPCKPGETHNPNGRPKGTKNFSTRLKELLLGMSEDNQWTSPIAAEKVQIAFGKDEKGKYLYPIQERQKAIDSILDRIEGKPKEKKEISGIDGNAIENKLIIEFINSNKDDSQVS